MASKSPFKRVKSKFITCILPKGAGVPLVRSLKDVKNVTTANVSSSRGQGMSVPVGKKGLGQQIEKDILTVIVSEKEADEVFRYIYETAGIYKPHSGFMYMGKLNYAMPFLLPNVPEEQL